jgi:formate--tetrahydrofolate ligase
LSESGAQQFRHLYEDSIPLWEKVNTIAKSIYGASEIVADKVTREQFKTFESAGYGNFPICMAKTQYSFSTDPNLKGAPSGHVVQIREIRLSAGAEFIVVVTGEIMTMPGLPRTPAASSIKMNSKGEISGLF